MDSRNAIIGAIVVLVLLVGGYFLWSTSSGTSPTATTTPTGVSQPTSTTPPTPAASAGLPAVITGPLTGASDNGAVVTGYVAPNGSPTTYWYDYGASASLNNRSTAHSAGSGFVTLATPAFIGGLAPSSVYYYRLSAQNAFGSVQGSTYSFMTAATAPPAGAKPAVTTDAATGVGRTDAMVNGHVDPNNAQTSYWFEYGPTQSFGSVSAFGSAGSGTDSLAASATLANLDAATKYYYRIDAQNQYGMVSGATNTFTTTGPAATGLPTVNTTAATNIATSSAMLNGRINPHSTASTYWFEYGTSPLLITVLGTASPTQTLPGEATTNVSSSATGLDTNTKYYFRLVARNPSGTTRGDIVSFTTKR